MQSGGGGGGVFPGKVLCGLKPRLRFLKLNDKFQFCENIKTKGVDEGSRNERG